MQPTGICTYSAALLSKYFVQPAPQRAVIPRYCLPAALNHHPIKNAGITGKVHAKDDEGTDGSEFWQNESSH